jgi:hypothetical protein
MTPGTQPVPARLASGTRIHYVAFNLVTGTEYVCVPSVVRELGMQSSVRGVASPPLGATFEFRTMRGGPSDPGTWHYPKDCGSPAEERLGQV